MKHLFPTITCLLTAHRKPTLRDSLASIIGQTRTDAQVLVLDSGAWMRMQDETDLALARIYSDYSPHPMIEWIFTGENSEQAKSACMVARVTNEVIKADLVRGEYFCTFYDDDRYYPHFFERMAGYLDTHPNCQAVRCSEQWMNLAADGSTEQVRVLRADRVLTAQDAFDCVVDGMQVMYRTQAVTSLPQPIIPDDPQTCRHSDGLFFEKLKTTIPQMDFIDEILCEHRFTPYSTFTKSS